MKSEEEKIDIKDYIYGYYNGIKLDRRAFNKLEKEEKEFLIKKLKTLKKRIRNFEKRNKIKFIMFYESLGNLKRIVFKDLETNKVYYVRFNKYNKEDNDFYEIEIEKTEKAKGYFDIKFIRYKVLREVCFSERVYTKIINNRLPL